MNNQQIINVGPLTSFNSLNLYLGPELTKLRNSYLSGEGLIPIWDLRNISPKGASIAALTSFLSISKKVRDFIGSPIEIIAHWQPQFQGFLSDIGFIKIATEFDLYDWKGLLGGYRTGVTNPQTKIFYYSDLPLIDRANSEEVANWKDLKRQEIKHSIIFRISNLFNSKSIDNNWSQNLESVLTITMAELVVNSLLHGNDIAFVGIQRSGRRVTTAVCDSGIGFPKSMHINQKREISTPLISHLEGLLQASLQSKNKIGLYRAIDDIIDTDGYVIMSSFDAEIRWQSQIWEIAKSLKINSPNEKIEIEGLGDPIEGFVGYERINQGYYKKYNDFLLGSRITFELPF